MAKVKGPLMSMDARGQIGKTLVFLGWKGIKDVRTYVIPSNPKSDGQVAQRGLLTAAVGFWHSVAFNTLDLAAFNLLALLEPAVMSGFNAFCKTYIALIKAAQTVLYARQYTTMSNAGGAVSISITCDDAVLLDVWYGTSLTSLTGFLSLAKVGGVGPFLGDIENLVAGTDLFMKFKTQDVATTVLSGIYKVRVLA